MSVDIRRGTARFVDREPGRITHHGFSFGGHYDAERVAFGPLVCHDDHLVGAGRGFASHRHTGLDIVTYVVSGVLEHDGPTGPGRVPAGSLAVLAAGSGAEHAEHASAEGPCRFVQVWLTGSDAAPPTYRVESGPTLEVGSAHLDVVRLDALAEHALPAAPLVHAFVATGALTRSSMAEPLAAGDAFLMTEEPSHVVRAAVPSVLLVWTFTAPEG